MIKRMQKVIDKQYEQNEMHTINQYHFIGDFLLTMWIEGVLTTEQYRKLRDYSERRFEELMGLA